MLAAEREHAAGQIGAIDARQDEETGVVGHQRKAAAALHDVPADPILTVPEVVGGGTPAQQRQPVPIDFGHITELLADERVALEIVMIFDERAVTVAFDGIVRRDQSNAHMLKDILFRHCGDAVARCGHA